MRLIIVLIGIGLLSCCYWPQGDVLYDENQVLVLAIDTNIPLGDSIQFMELKKDVWVSNYFESVDSICRSIDSLFGIELNEYELTHANRWIVDTLMSFDYYRARTHGKIILDQKACCVMHKGDCLLVPDAKHLQTIRADLESVVLEVNIPEFVLRIWQADSCIYHCPVRVGKNERKYLALAGHEVDLRTPIGEGSIVRIERNPMYINPVDGHRYTSTRRDDGTYTALPRIPFLEPELNGIRYGSLIHPTTNYSTLGKAISNGCVGLSEADAWMVYYHAPLGTRVRFRYDLEVIDSTGQRKTLRDIYQKNTSPK